MSEKRRDYISWDEYFMGVAMLTGMRQQAVRMMNSHGDGKVLRWRTNTCLPHTVS